MASTQLLFQLVGEFGVQVVVDERNVDALDRPNAARRELGHLALRPDRYHDFHKLLSTVAVRIASHSRF